MGSWALYAAWGTGGRRSKQAAHLRVEVARAQVLDRKGQALAICHLIVCAQGLDVDGLWGLNLNSFLIWIQFEFESGLRRPVVEVVAWKAGWQAWLLCCEALHHSAAHSPPNCPAASLPCSIPLKQKPLASPPTWISLWRAHTILPDESMDATWVCVKGGKGASIRAEAWQHVHRVRWG